MNEKIENIQKKYNKFRKNRKRKKGIHQTIRNVIRTYASQKAHSIVMTFVMTGYRTYMKIRCWYAGLWDQRYIKQTGFNIPPASLRYRARGITDPDIFLGSSKKSSQDIESALMKIGKNLDSFQHILDFGCGCGSTLMWLANRSSSSHFYGTDIDEEAISWCHNNLSFASFNVNKTLPPLEYYSNMFDLIYVISVFTHLNENYQFCWLSELKRIIKPKGILLLTVHGYNIWKSLPDADVAKIKEDGFAFITSDSWKGIFPEWYQNTYHTKKYILNNYTKYFDILDYIPRGMNNYQDIIILQKV